jgi:hypothetical protein
MGDAHRFHNVFFARALLILAAVGTTASMATAQTPSGAPADHEQERAALYQEGLDLADAGRWSDALDRFRRVVEIRPAPKALFTLAQAEEKVGKLGAAQRTYLQALASAHVAEDAAVVRASEEALRSIDPRVPRLTIRLNAPPSAGRSEVRAAIDGGQVTIGEPVPLDAGEHEVRVEQTGARAFFARVTLAERQRLEVTAALELEQSRPGDAARPSPNPPVPVPPSPSVEHRTPSKAWVGPFLLGAFGVAATATGLIVRFAAKSSYDGARAQCPDGNCPRPDLRDDGNSARSLMIAGTWGAGVGLAALAGAGAWWFFSARDAKMAASLDYRPGGVLFALRGRFPL